MIEALVIGGGPAGASLAIRLARAGREVTLLEREAGPHDKVCGEFLSQGAAASLTALGLDPEALGAQAIGEVRLVRRDRVAQSPLPFQALSLSRRLLDEALLALAEQAGARVLRGLRATETVRAGMGWRVQTTGEPFRALDVFLATGKHDLRGLHRPAGMHGDLLGFKQHWRLADAQTQALDGAVELHLFDGGYCGLERIEGGLTNLCLVVRKAAFGDWPSLLERLRGTPGLGGRLAGGEPVQPKPLAVSAIPYGHVQRTSDGLWRLGDQAAVIPSFAGEGMAIALASAERAAEAYLGGKSAAEYQARLARRIGGRVKTASLLSHGLVHGWSQGLAAGLAGMSPRLLSSLASVSRV